MSFRYITYEKSDRIVTISMNRPESLNALHPAANKEMQEAFINFAQDDTILVAILTGTGKRAFSSGNDLRYTAEEKANPYEYEIPLGGITGNLSINKPLMAAVNGYALGGGFELALACDLIIAADHAEFGLPEPTLGLVASTGVHRLPRNIPFKKAMAMILTAKRITAEEASQLGLVNEVVPYSLLMETAQHWAKRILKLAPLAVKASKQMAIQGFNSPLEIAIEGQYSEFLKVLQSQDMIEGPRSFVEKRKPEWTGS